MGAGTCYIYIYIYIQKNILPLPTYHLASRILFSDPVSILTCRPSRKPRPRKSTVGFSREPLTWQMIRDESNKHPRMGRSGTHTIPIHLGRWTVGTSGTYSHHPWKERKMIRTIHLQGIMFQPLIFTRGGLVGVPEISLESGPKTRVIKNTWTEWEKTEIQRRRKVQKLTP